MSVSINKEYYWKIHHPTMEFHVKFHAKKDISHESL